MNPVKKIMGAALFVGGATLAGAGIVHAAEPLPLDQPTLINGVPVACAGVGEDDRNDPRWSDYNAKIEVARSNGDYLGSETVTVAGAGNTNVSVSCTGPWVLMKLPAGGYKITTDVPDQPSKVVTTQIGANRPNEIIVTFPAGGLPNQNKSQN